MRLGFILILLSFFSCGYDGSDNNIQPDLEDKSHVGEQRNFTVQAEIDAKAGSSCSSESREFVAPEKKYSLEVITFDADVWATANFTRKYDASSNTLDNMFSLSLAKVMIDGTLEFPASEAENMFIKPLLPEKQSYEILAPKDMLSIDRKLLNHNDPCGLFLYTNAVDIHHAAKAEKFLLSKTTPVVPRAQINIASLKKYLRNPLVVDFNFRSQNPSVTTQLEVRRTFKLSGANKIIETNEILTPGSNADYYTIGLLFGLFKEVEYEYSTTGRLVRQTITSYFLGAKDLIITLE